MRPTSTPYTPPRQLFPNPWMPGWRLAQPPLSELWLFGWGSAVSNLSQQRFPGGGREWEICTTTHLCRAEIGWKQMAARWMLPSARGHPPEKLTSQGGFFFPFIICCDSTPNWEKCDFFFSLTPTLLPQTALISKMRWTVRSYRGHRGHLKKSGCQALCAPLLMRAGKVWWTRSWGLWEQAFSRDELKFYFSCTGLFSGFPF